MPQFPFIPDYAVPPGETLREVLDMKGISQSDLALRTGITEKTISQIVNGAAPITYVTAAKLELSLDVPARFWNSRESQYRETLLRIEEENRLESEVEWLKGIPVKELVERRFIQASSDKGQIVREVLKFFCVSSVEAWDSVWLKPQLQFRGASIQESRPGYVAAWVRMGEIAAEAIECQSYSEKKFREAIKKARSLTILPSSEWQPKLLKLCASAGVAFVLVKEIPKAGISGVTKWITKNKAIIMLSLKYNSDDQFWFSFFHESCHVLKHSKKIIFYEQGYAPDNADENAADKFARDVLIPPEHVPTLALLQYRKTNIRAFAAQIGIAPGIVVGRMQHDGLIPNKFCNDLKRKYRWPKNA